MRALALSQDKHWVKVVLVEAAIGKTTVIHTRLPVTVPKEQRQIKVHERPMAGILAQPLDVWVLPRNEQKE